MEGELVHSDEELGAKVLFRISEGSPRTSEPKQPFALRNKEDDKENYFEQSSLADDDDKEFHADSDQENPQNLMEVDSSSISYQMPLFTKLSGEVVLQLTSLYSPVPATQAIYDKSSLIKRVCKNSASQSDYQNYARNLREYKAQLKDIYESLVKNSLDAEVQDSLAVPKKDYQKRFLVKRLRELDSMIKELETYVPTADTSPSLSEKLFYNIKNSDFTEKIVWETAKCADRSLGKRKIIKGTELDETKAELIFINYNEKEIPSLKKMISFEHKDPFDTDFPSYHSHPIAMKSSKVAFSFKKTKGKPGKVDLQPAVEKSSDLWGEPLRQKRKSDSKEPFTLKHRKLLFEENSSCQASEIPTNINSLFQSSAWKDLVFNRHIYNLKEKYGKLLVNPLDPNNMEIAEAENSEPEEELEDYSESGYDRDDEFESRFDKSLFSESSLLGGKINENSMKSKFTMLKHASPAYEYPFVKTEWTKEELRHFHRPQTLLRGKKWKTRLPRSSLSNPAYENKGENTTAYVTLSTAKQLSVKEGPFLLLEYLEKRPPLMNNFGMAGKVKRYYKGGKKNFDDYPKYIGHLGLAEVIDSNRQFPLIGNLQESSGMSVFESNLFRVPLYFHAARPTDFLLVKYNRGDNKFKCYLRYIENLSTTGQIEPKVDVMAPNARLTNAFQQKRIQAFIYKTLLANTNRIDLKEVSHNFTSINESTIRKQMKNINCEQYPDGSWSCSKLPSEQEVREMITPEEICQYESMLAGQRRLKDKGIKITSIDKVPNAIQKLKKEMENKKISFWADFIEEELTITPWNLTSSYLKTKGEKGMMRITGIGDPTHGNCGFSFVRLPMKLPNLDKFFSKNDPSDYLPTNMTVTGTNADLRTLTKEEVTKILINLGCSKEELKGLGRWTGVAKLRSKASEMVSEGYKGSIERYARGIRMSTKMQKEQCQKTIDDILLRQIKILGEKTEFHSDRSTDSEGDSIAKFVVDDINKPVEDKTKRMDLEGDIEDNDKKIYNDFIKTVNKFSVPAADAVKTGVKKVLKRITRMPNLKGTITVKVTYITDPVEIENYYKRKEEAELPKNKDKTKRTNDSIEQRVFKSIGKKSKKEDWNGRKDDKRSDDKKSKLDLGQSLNKGENSGNGAAKIVCGKCGMHGHMKTNRKKCPLFSTETSDVFKAEKEGMVKAEGSKIKLSIDKIQQVAEKKKEEHFYGDYSRPKTISARRRRQIEENLFEDICFKLIRFDHTKDFINPVKKDIYPDYYNLIKNPIDLSAMNSKDKRGEYASAQCLISDLDLMINNSVIYNGSAHFVTEQAARIKEEALRLLREKELLIDIPESESL